MKSAAGFLSLLFCTIAAADDGAVASIHVRGTGKVEKNATELALSFTLSAKGDDIAKAAAALEARRLACVEKLKALGADEKQIRATTPALERKNPQQMQRRPSLRLKKKKEGEGAEKEPVILSSLLSARMPLKASDKTALFIEGEQIKAKIKAAKLVDGGKGEAGADEEEEPQDRQENDGTEDGFSFMYLVAVEAKDLDEAAQKAMGVARKLAESGARSAGKTLGALMKVELGESASGGMSPEEMYYYQRRGHRAPMTEDGTVGSNSPDGLEVTVILGATFALK